MTTFRRRPPQSADPRVRDAGILLVARALRLAAGHAARGRAVTPDQLERWAGELERAVRAPRGAA